MKVLPILLGLLFITTTAFADVIGDVISIEKIVDRGKPFIRVITQYTVDGVRMVSRYPHGDWVTNYDYKKFSKENVLNDVKTHCETITKLYIEGNTDKVFVEEEKIIDNHIQQQESLSSESIDKISNISYSIDDLYISDVNITIDATGTLKEAYK